jgi:hypothetical protein
LLQKQWIALYFFTQFAPGQVSVLVSRFEVNQVLYDLDPLDAEDVFTFEDHPRMIPLARGFESKSEFVALFKWRRRKKREGMIAEGPQFSIVFFASGEASENSAMPIGSISGEAGFNS